MPRSTGRDSPPSSVFQPRPGRGGIAHARANPERHWSRRALARLGMRGVPAGLGQDGRDAIGAALLAREHERGTTERFGDILVPLGRWQRVKE